MAGKSDWSYKIPTPCSTHYCTGAHLEEGLREEADGRKLRGRHHDEAYGG